MKRIAFTLAAITAVSVVATPAYATTGFDELRHENLDKDALNFDELRRENLDKDAGSGEDARREFVKG